jgi:translation initiation factor 6
MSFNENPNVGVFCRANEKIAFIQKGLTKKDKKRISNTLETDLIELSIADASIIGSLLAMNSNGAVVCDLIDKKSYDIIVDQGLNLCVISDKINAAGNDILVNDNAAIVHPDLKEITIEEIKETFEVPIYRGTIGKLKTVGMAAVVTNKGLLCHPKASDEELTTLKKIFKVDVLIGTVNHGSPIIGSGLIANTKGAIIGNLTTGIEMGRIEEALGFLD